MWYSQLISKNLCTHTSKITILPYISGGVADMYFLVVVAFSFSFPTNQSKLAQTFLLCGLHYITFILNDRDIMATRPLTSKFVEIRNSAKSHRTLRKSGDDVDPDVPILVRFQWYLRTLTCHRSMQFIIFLKIDFDRVEKILPSWGRTRCLQFGWTKSTWWRRTFQKFGTKVWFISYFSSASNYQLLFWVNLLLSSSCFKLIFHLTVKELNGLHSKRLMVNFEMDEAAQERNIDACTHDITDLFRQSESLLKQFGKLGDESKISPQERTIRHNVQTSIAKRLQGLSMTFRSSQKVYLVLSNACKILILNLLIYFCFLHFRPRITWTDCKRRKLVMVPKTLRFWMPNAALIWILASLQCKNRFLTKQRR